MCGRYELSSHPAAIALAFGLAHPPDIRPRYNIAPTQQVPIVNRVFLPNEQEVAWARRVVEAFEASREGVLAVNGEMIDLPVVERARRVLDEAERSSA